MAEKKKVSVLAAVVGWAALAVLMVSCLNLGSDPAPKTDAEIAAERLTMAYIRCENDLKSRMADPDGFRVADYSTWRRDPASTENHVILRFEAVGRNAFGALVPSDVTCTLDHDGTYWTVTDLVLG